MPGEKAKAKAQFRAQAKEILEAAFNEIDTAILQGNPPPPTDSDLEPKWDILFVTDSQGYREALLGCTVARIQDRNINIRLPYVKQGPKSISLRMFDQQVINPFFHNKSVPSTKGPYLSMFRRGYQFTEDYTASPKDPRAHRAFLDCISRLESISEPAELVRFLRYLLYRFWKLREDAAVPLTRIRRLTLSQYDRLITGLLSVPSGGRLPVLLVLATLRTLRRFFGLSWEIEFQGINVSDKASGAGGDITIKSGGDILMAAEVTERIVDRARLLSTFNTKITPASIVDYLFFTKSATPEPDAQKLADQYFTQGHEVNFLEIKTWMLTILATISAKGRDVFNAEILEQLDQPDTPKAVKVAWNDQIAIAIS